MNGTLRTVFFFLCAGAAVLGARETYLGGSGYWVDNNTDGAVGAAARVGWHFPPPEEAKYRISTDVEAEVSYWAIENAIDYRAGPGKADTRTLPVLANLRVNVPLADTGLFLYGGGGAGMAFLDVDGTGPLGGNVDDTGTVFAYGFFAGLGGRVTARVEVRLGYRALWITEDDFNDGSGAEASLETERNDLFEIALRYSL